MLGPQLFGPVLSSSCTCAVVCLLHCPLCYSLSPVCPVTQTHSRPDPSWGAAWCLYLSTRDCKFGECFLSLHHWDCHYRTLELSLPMYCDLLASLKLVILH